MKTGTRIFIPALIACLLPPVFTGCQEKDNLRPDERVTVSFSMPVGQTIGGLSTKMSGEVVQNDLSQTSFRGIQELYVLPFIIQKQGTNGENWREEVWSTDEYGDIRTMPGYNSLKDYLGDNGQTIKGYIFDRIVMNRDVNTVLVYGQATETSSNATPSGSVTYKQHYGSLVPTHLMDVNVAGSIRFDLEPFLNGSDQKQAFAAWKAANLGLLNEVADASVTIEGQTYSFKTPSSYNNAPLEAALNAFTSDGAVFPGSNAMIGLKLTALYKTCTTLSTTADTEPVRKLAAQVCTIIDDKTELLEVNNGTVTRKVATDEVFGLPDGVVTMRWGFTLSDGSLGFESPDKPEGVNVTAVDAFCFPPALWYYVNCPLLSNSEDNAKDLFVADTKWSDILKSDKGWIRGITNVTRVAAVRDQMQYAVALLRLDISKTASTTLKDNAEVAVNVPVDNDNFPLTGIIFGGQRTQAYDFTVWDDPDNDMRFIYDADMNDQNGAAQAWISSTTASKPVFTLALSTRTTEDVNFALEFRNDSDTAFTGVHGCTILPGSKFYLIGTMEYSKGTTSGTRPPSVFVKDHYTTLNVSFDALASSYAILPDLRQADLQLGVNTKLTWDALSSTSVPIK